MEVSIICNSFVGMFDKFFYENCEVLMEHDGEVLISKIMKGWLLKSKFWKVRYLFENVLSISVCSFLLYDLSIR